MCDFSFYRICLRYKVPVHQPARRYHGEISLSRRSNSLVYIIPRSSLGLNSLLAVILISTSCVVSVCSDGNIGIGIYDVIGVGYTGRIVDSSDNVIDQTNTTEGNICGIYLGGSIVHCAENSYAEFAETPDTKNWGPCTLSTEISLFGDYMAVLWCCPL
ncbi:hypothetical protein DFH11DRAFT_1124267 [Phellopilus nigrolimitatus]|nr:hypothetical protein DFH11DRAFT_1124267 [Phellopilus nigrolimitatus]